MFLRDVEKLHGVAPLITLIPRFEVEVEKKVGAVPHLEPTAITITDTVTDNTGLFVIFEMDSP